ncbi:threonine--tRNA ligase [Patescibacteria group bacterium]|nr:threonine--tRNA ligase [Patescibacteria group bacterium]
MAKENIELVRHGAAHLLAVAVQKLYPKTRFGVGPVVDNGFYYDMEVRGYDGKEVALGEAEMKKIEKQMKKMKAQGLKFVRKEMSIASAITMFKKLDQKYKVELLEDLKKKGTTRIQENKKTIKQENKKVTIYELGDFVDLCRGPHVASTKDIKIFKLQKLAGAYWRGNEKNKMLTRIYGLAFETEKEMEDYLHMQEEAERRDHRKLGKELELFLIDPVVGLGLPLWQPKGALVWQIIENYWHKEHLENGYDLVRSPHIGNRALWEKSGHWNFYSDSMYPPMEVTKTLEDVKKGRKGEGKAEEYLIKPMNCPFHVQIYKSRPWSYRDLPLRWAECGTVYRYEKSGEISGLTRVRGFTQDDAHIVCAESQVEAELKRVIKFIKKIFSTFGFKEYKIYLSLRDPKDKKKYAGNDKGWNFTEKVLEKVAKAEKLDYVKEEGEAAFYGPKLDFKIKDVLGREWQCSTLQFDFNLPERFGMVFKNSAGKEEQPYMLHRALFGSFERFIGLLIEHYAGAFPLWLSPVQVQIVPVGEAHKKICQDLSEKIKQVGARVFVDESDETVGYKIRKAEKDKVPYMVVIGDKEKDLKKVSVRERGSKGTYEIPVDKFLEKIVEEIGQKK